MPGAANGANPQNPAAPNPGASAAAAAVFGSAFAQQQQQQDDGPEPGNDANAQPAEPAEETLSRAESKRLIAQRDKFKAESRRVSATLNAIAEKLGIDPASDLQIEETEDGFALKSPA